MAQTSSAHEPLRQEWAETPPDVSYRFVVSLATLRAADAVVRARLQKKPNGRWRRAMAFFMRDMLRMVIGALVLALLAWLALQPALMVHGALDESKRLGSGAVLPVATFLVVFLGLFAGCRICNQADRRLVVDRVDDQARRVRRAGESSTSRGRVGGTAVADLSPSRLDGKSESAVVAARARDDAVTDLPLIKAAKLWARAPAAHPCHPTSPMPPRSKTKGDGCRL